MMRENEAVLSSGGGFTAFSFGGYNIRFKAPYSLERYTDVVKWEDGYLPGTIHRCREMGRWLFGSKGQISS